MLMGHSNCGCSDCGGGGGERGERGKRGHRGHRGDTGAAGAAGPAGATGATGATGPAGSGGLIKFSGVVAPGGLGGSLASFLADTGVGASVPATSIPLAYPVAIGRSLVNFSTNVLVGVVLPSGATLVLQLLHNGVPVAQIVYGPGPATISGIQSVAFAAVPFAIGDTFDVKATSNGIAVPVFVSATVGVQ